MHIVYLNSRLLWYDDNHSLLSDPVEMDHVVNTALWLLEHTTDKVEEPEEVVAEVKPAEPVAEAPVPSV